MKIYFDPKDMCINFLTLFRILRYHNITNYIETPKVLFLILPKIQELFFLLNWYGHNVLGAHYNLVPPAVKSLLLQQGAEKGGTCKLLLMKN